MWEIMLSRMRKYISIHAPAKGATSYAYSSIRGLINFNPRSREGSDIKLFQHSNVLDYFNPRSREGSDYTRAASAKHSDYFNPRSREGSDDAEVEAVNSAKISIHAPAKGATKPRGACLFPKRFQSTLPRRERPVEGRRRESAG